MKKERWTVSEVAEALGVSYDSVCNFVNSRGMSAKDGMSLKWIMEYVEAPKRQTTTFKNNDPAKVERLRRIIAVVYGEAEIEGQGEFCDEDFV